MGYLLSCVLSLRMSCSYLMVLFTRLLSHQVINHYIKLQKDGWHNLCHPLKALFLVTELVNDDLVVTEQFIQGFRYN